MEGAKPQTTLLIVDDTPENISVLSGVLSDYHQVKAATSGKKALGICAGDSPPDLVLLDVMMPEMDGYEVCRRLKSDEKTRDIPVIFVTAITDAQNEAQGFELGAVDYITKPISPPVVLQRVKLHLELEEARKKIEGLSRQYSSYISPQLAKSIRDGEITASIGSSRKKLTVFFSDIQGFTRQTEKLEPEDMTFLLNQYFDTMTDIVHRHGGTLDKYIGDAMLVFFGDPETRGVREDALECIGMALEMQEAMASLQDSWQGRGISAPLRVRMGITTGFCTVGNFGSSTQLAYTIMGTPVNLAARLQSYARPGVVMISEETCQLVGDSYECVAHQPIQVKGLSYAIQAYEVVAPVSRGTRCLQTDHCHMRVDIDALTDAERSGLKEFISELNGKL
ncbi:MAG: response regulator [Spirochaetes bacterium]|nr:response regulator [Spirochaetota bacterium]HPA72123.1 adenylate/guanylate cyclase domain-containing protein [Spirochaetota bacterium]